MHGSLEEISAERNRAEIGSRQKCTAVSFIISIARGGGRGKRARRFLFFETALLVKVSFAREKKKKKGGKDISIRFSTSTFKSTLSSSPSLHFHLVSFRTLLKLRIRKRRDTILSGGMNNSDYSSFEIYLCSTRNANNLAKFYSL